MRYIRLVGLTAVLLITACGQPGDLASPATTSESPSAISTSASSIPRTSVANAQPVPCPTFAVYPPPAPGETPTPTNTPPPPTPTVDPEAVPTGTAPGGLGSITLPNDDATIRGIFAALPEKIGDYQLFEARNEDPSYFMTTYQLPNADPSDLQGKLMLGAIGDFDPEPRFPNRIIAPYADYWRRDGQVFYGYYDRRSTQPLDNTFENCREDLSVDFSFVAQDSAWTFHTQAPTREELELVVAAFVQAVKSSPAPIPYSTPTPYPTPGMTALPQPNVTPADRLPGVPNPSYPPPADAIPPQLPTTTPGS